MTSKVRKITGAVLIVLSLVVTQIPALKVSANDPNFKINGDTLVKYTGSGDIVEIPASVKVIGDEAFEGNDNIKEIKIGDGVKEIRYHAFFDCNNLEKVEIGDKTEIIGNGAFGECDLLSEVSVGSKLSSLGYGVFAGDGLLSAVSFSGEDFVCTDGVIYDAKMKHLYEMLPGSDITFYEMPDSVEDISMYSFWGCNNLKFVTLSQGLSDIPDYSFSNCRSLSAISIPSSVRNIFAKAFENCSALSGVEIPDSVRFIHDTAFDGCGSVKILANSYSTAGEYAGKNSITFITRAEYEELLAGVVSGSDEAVPEEGTDSEDLLSDGLLTGDSSDSNNDNTDNSDNSDISDSTDNSDINGSEDYEADKTSYDAKDSDDEACDDSLFGQTTVVSGQAVLFIDNTTLPVFDGSMDTPLIFQEVPEEESIADYKKNRPEEMIGSSNEKGLYVPKFTIAGDSVANHAYYGNMDLYEYLIPDNVTRIGEFSFARSGLSYIEIPDTVTRIEYGAFYHASLLSGVIIPESVTYIGDSAFENTPYLDNFRAGTEDFLIVGDGILLCAKPDSGKIEIPEGVKRIAPGCFRNKSGIVSIVLPSSIEEISDEAFMGCSTLSSITGLNNVSAIGDRAFYGCPLQYVTIPESIGSIGVMAFSVSGTIREKHDSVVKFSGDILPVTTYNEATTKYYNREYRGLTFPDADYAIINENAVIEGSVLDPDKAGFRGIILKETKDVNENGENGYIIYRVTIPGFSQETSSLPEDFSYLNNTYSIIGTDKNAFEYYGSPEWEGDVSKNKKINLSVISSIFPANEAATVMLPGNEETLFVTLEDSKEAEDIIVECYDKLYSKEHTFNIHGFDLSCTDDNDIQIKEFGTNRLEITLQVPDDMKDDLIYVMCLDDDGQLEAVDCETFEVEGIRMIRFYVSHFSPYAFCSYSQETIDKIKGKLDISPDTGDKSVSPFIFPCIAVLLLGIILLLWPSKKNSN